MKTTTAETIDQYISEQPPEIQLKLKELRDAIKKAAPKAEEKISYAMPTFSLYGNLVHFAAMKNHIGFYPAPSAIVQFKTQLKDYATSKGAVQFPLEEPIPLSLVRKIVKFRVIENTAKAASKMKKK